MEILKKMVKKLKNYGNIESYYGNIEKHYGNIESH